MNNPWKLILLLVAIFTAGGVAGWFLAKEVGREMAAKRPKPEEWAPRQIKRLTLGLDLTPEQIEQVRVIVKRDSEELNRLRNYSFNETKLVFARMEQEISEKLTPEQKVKFDQMNKEMREREKKSMPDRSNRAGQPAGAPKPAPDSPAVEPAKPPVDQPPAAKPPGN